MLFLKHSVYAYSNTTAILPVGRQITHVDAADAASVGTELVRVLAANADRHVEEDADVIADAVETAEDVVPK